MIRSKLFDKNKFLFLFGLCFAVSLSAQKINSANIHVLYSPLHASNSFIPSENIGGAIDGHFKGDINKMLTPENISEMKLAGLKPVSYRLRTELAGEVWHWNPEGKWSDSAKQQGYWISDSESDKPIELSYGYRLPRRGNTHDQANDDGYSKISDGDTSTFWKSNPYLDTRFTHDANSEHPQWVIVDLGKRRSINAIQIRWGNPYALSYMVEYAKGNDPSYFDPFEPGIWHSFQKQFIDNQGMKNNVEKISDRLQKARFIRVSFTESSYSSDKISADIRDKLGFAIKEMRVGFLDENGKFHDWIHHSPDHKQSVIYVSSTDPWHTSKDIDMNTEQVGIDRFFADGITQGKPALIPAAVLYDSPDNMLALINHIKAKHYNVKEIEMGEEPEGQRVSPVDYAALYYQLGKKIKEIDTAMKMGGPCFASLSASPDDSSTFTETKWTSLFLNYLKSHNGINLFNFFSFEWYPFDDLCAPSSPQLAAAPGMLSTALENFKQDILPAKTPLYITEYGYSAYEGKSEVEMQGALLYADILGKFIELGGGKSFLYGYEPAFLQQSTHCGYGNNMLFGLGLDEKLSYKTSSFYSIQMLTHYWAQPSDSFLEIYPSETNIFKRKKRNLISTYSLRSPDGKWSVMLINKDPERSWNVNIDIQNMSTNKNIKWHPAQLIQYSKQQYDWVDDGIKSHPSRNFPPVLKKITSAENIILPPYSLTIVK